MKLKCNRFKGILYALVLIHLSSCASIKKWWNNDENDAAKNSMPNTIPVPPVVAQPPDDTIRFSENPNVGTFNERRYRRATRKSIEEDSDVGSRAGSLWNTEGPSSYLFTQNKLHREGDLLNIKIEGNAKNQMETKINVIKKLLARLEIINATPSPSTSDILGQTESGDRNEGTENSRNPASVQSSSSNSKNPGVNNESKSTNAQNSTNLNPSASELESPINIETVPTRVTERMSDGNYRVKGHQSFNIGKKEFKVILTGLVRPEDFTDEGMSSNKLLDPQLDIVSLRRNMQ